MQQPLVGPDAGRTNTRANVALEILMTESFAQMFEESLASQKIKPGAILMGRVIDVGPDVVLVNDQKAAVTPGQSVTARCMVYGTTTSTDTAAWTMISTRSLG